MSESVVQPGPDSFCAAAAYRFNQAICFIFIIAIIIINVQFNYLIQIYFRNQPLTVYQLHID